MPKLGVEKLEKVFLPSTANEPNEADKAWVIVNTSIMANVMIGAEQLSSQTEKSASMIADALKEWNLTEVDSDKIADINTENVLHLVTVDFSYLSNLLAGKVNEQKAGLSSDLKGV